MNNLPKVVTQQRRGRASNPRLLDRKSDALPLSHRATPSRVACRVHPKNVQERRGKPVAREIRVLEDVHC